MSDNTQYQKASALIAAVKNRTAKPSFGGAVLYSSDGMIRKARAFRLDRFSPRDLEHAEALTGALAISLFPNHKRNLTRIFTFNHDAIDGLQSLDTDFETVSSLDENLLGLAKWNVERMGSMPEFSIANRPKDDKRKLPYGVKMARDLAKNAMLSFVTTYVPDELEMSLRRGGFDTFGEFETPDLD